MVVEKSKHQHEVEELEVDEEDLEIWRPRNRDRRLSDSFIGLDREEC